LPEAVQSHRQYNHTGSTTTQVRAGQAGQAGQAVIQVQVRLVQVKQVRLMQVRQSARCRQVCAVLFPACVHIPPLPLSLHLPLPLTCVSGRRGCAARRSARVGPTGS
jgi:hypothetical protein